ncbi:MAG: RNA methyltransferase [Rikenellaceae bacterium]
MLNSRNADTLQKEIDHLSTLMSEERYANIKYVLSQRTKYMTVCLENIYHPQNASAVIRSAEAFGIQNVHVIEDISYFRPNIDIVQGSDRWIDITRYSRDTTSRYVIEQLKNKGYKILAATPHGEDYTPQTVDISSPFALFMGTEKQGISSVLEENADSFIKIPMCGFVESLNVSVCAAIMMQTLTDRMRNSDIAWQLSNDEKIEILHRWMQYAVRDSKTILNRFRQDNE